MEYDTLDTKDMVDNRDALDKFADALINWGKEDPYLKRLQEANLDRKKRRDELDRQAAAQIYAQGRADDASMERLKATGASNKELEELRQTHENNRSKQQSIDAKDLADLNSYYRRMDVDEAAGREFAYGQAGADA